MRGISVREVVSELVKWSGAAGLGLAGHTRTAVPIGTNVPEGLAVRDVTGRCPEAEDLGLHSRIHGVFAHGGCCDYRSCPEHD